MSPGIQDREQAWLGRMTSRIEDMRGWDADQWEVWWADGLDIWFSEFPLADREQAFAPLLIDPVRERAETRLPDLMRRFYESAHMSDAKIAMRLQNAIEEGALRVLASRGHVGEVARARLLINIFVARRARRLAEIINAVLIASGRGWLTDEPLDGLLSAISYAIVDQVDPTRFGKDVRDQFESILFGQVNFRPALFYAMRLSRKDVEACLTKFGFLWRDEASYDADVVWKAVSEELNSFYGRKVVARKLRKIMARSTVWDDRSEAWAYLPAQYLAPLYADALEGDEASGLAGLAAKISNLIPRSSPGAEKRGFWVACGQRA